MRKLSRGTHEAQHIVALMRKLSRGTHEAQHIVALMAEIYGSGVTGMQAVGS